MNIATIKDLNEDEIKLVLDYREHRKIKEQRSDLSGILFDIANEWRAFSEDNDVDLQYAVFHDEFLATKYPDCDIPPATLYKSLQKLFFLSHDCAARIVIQQQKRERLQVLYDGILHHSTLYYIKSEPVIGDGEFDALVSEARSLEHELFPDAYEYRDKHSILAKVEFNCHAGFVPKMPEQHV